MAKKAQRQLALERDLASKAEAEGQDPPPLMLRDHTGGCCDGYLLERGLLTLEQCPQGDGALTAPPSTDGGWVTDMRVISNIAPAIAEQTILNFYAPLGAKEDASVRVLERGYAHIEGLRVLQDYAYHPAPIPERPDVVCTRMMIRASFKATSYCTVVWYQIDTQSTCTIKPVLKVLKVLCAPAKEGGDYCRASAASHDMKYAFCTHGSANIQVLRNLPRADNVAIPDDLRSRTSQLQAWSNPGMGETNDIGMPAVRALGPRPSAARPAAAVRLPEHDHPGEVDPVPARPAAPERPCLGSALRGAVGAVRPAQLRLCEAVAQRPPAGQRRMAPLRQPVGRGLVRGGGGDGGGPGCLAWRLGRWAAAPADEHRADQRRRGVGRLARLGGGRGGGSGGCGGSAAGTGTRNAAAAVAKPHPPTSDSLAGSVKVSKKIYYILHHCRPHCSSASDTSMSSRCRMSGGS